MADVRSLSRNESLESADWIIVERVESGRFRASGLSAVDAAVFGPSTYDNERQAVGAAQTWAFHNSVPVIYVRASA